MSYVDKTLLFYLNQINKIPLLTREQEYELACKARSGNAQAKQKLVSSNLRFVVQMAKRYAGSNLSLMDLVSEGNIGLLRAVETFDPDKGFHFISYAVHWIKQSIIKAISEKSKLVRIPLNLNNSLSHIEKSLRERHHGELTDRAVEDVSREMKMEKGDLLNLIEVTRPASSLDKIFDDENGGRPLRDVVEDQSQPSPPSVAEFNALQGHIREVLSTLPDSEAEILVLRFGLDGSAPMTLLEIGKRKGLTKERIRQIEKKALQALKAPQRSQRLMDFVA
ncbi:MAG: RNA polymerase sigma factor RpoD/SigA [Spirochaetes bacterium]|nr:RNA polymerase sigma factor RpoD/SigA [Spirochaetota bacterium]